MKTTEIKASELKPNQMFTSVRTPGGYVCLRLSQLYRLFHHSSQALNTIVLPCDDMAGPTLAYFAGDETVWRIDEPDSLVSVMAEINAEEHLRQVAEQTHDLPTAEGIFLGIA